MASLHDVAHTLWEDLKTAEDDDYIYVVYRQWGRRWHLAKYLLQSIDPITVDCENERFLRNALHADGYAFGMVKRAKSRSRWVTLTWLESQIARTHDSGDQHFRLADMISFSH